MGQGTVSVAPRAGTGDGHGGILTPGCFPPLPAGLTLCLKKQVHWHVIGLGTGPEVHSVFFEGHTFLVRGHRLSSLEISPATYLTAQTMPGTAGQFRMFCQIPSHQQGNLSLQEPGGKEVQGMARALCGAAAPRPSLFNHPITTCNLARDRDAMCWPAWGHIRWG